MFFSDYKNILALSPHTDDIELGCGATLHKLKENGANIHVLNFSRSKNSNDDKGDAVAQEFIESMNYLGATYEMMNLPTRELSNYRQEILDKLWQVKNANDYDLIFCHSRYDQHQDHQVVQRECFRAFKNKTILGYELPWNCTKFSTDVFVRLEKKHLNKKIKMLDFYKSQNHRPFMCKEYVFDIARTRGLQIQEKYAECFELIRMVG